MSRKGEVSKRKPESKRGQVSLTVLVPDGVVEQLDFYIEELKRQQPGHGFTRAGAVCEILALWQRQRLNKAKQLAQKAGAGGTQ